MIANTKADGELEVKVGSDAVSLDGKADIRILSLDGKLLDSAKDASSVSTANIKGAYIISVEKDGKVLKTVKSVK